MSYLVLARKYRPANFKEVRGQEPITRTLINSIAREQIAHAYLFCGPRGVGKTSIARIFAKSLNCVKGPTAEPCLKCQNCKDIAASISLAVREIDGASHNSVENVRSLIDSFRSLPPPGSKYKIYIIDEVHMLSTAAFNALLKSLEEPPANTIFILATTEPHKILPTVISRCQRFDLRSLAIQEVEASLQEISQQEGKKIDLEVLRLVARLSEGSLRDAQSLLERVIAFCDDKITTESAADALGVIARPTLLRLSQCIFNRQPSEALEIVASIFSTGADPVLFLKEFVSHWRELLIAKFSASEQLAIDLDTMTELKRQVEPVAEQDLQDLVQIARDGADQALKSSYLKYAFESLVVRMATRVPVVELSQLLKTGAPPASVQKKKPLATPVKQVAQKPRQVASLTKELDWVQFVSQVDLPPVYVEHLRRLVLCTFELGTLHVKGPEFSVKYLEHKVNQEKLSAKLKEYFQHQNWAFTFEQINQEGLAESSIRGQERKKIEKEQKDKASELVNHPQVKLIQDLFPGSVIDQVAVKTSE